MRAIHLAELAETLPYRETMRAPHKSRHTSARFTTRNPRANVNGAGR